MSSNFRGWFEQSVIVLILCFSGYRNWWGHLDWDLGLQKQQRAPGYQESLQGRLCANSLVVQLVFVMRWDHGVCFVTLMLILSFPFQEYKKDLEDDVRADTSGDFRAVLLEILKVNVAEHLSRSEYLTLTLWGSIWTGFWLFQTHLFNLLPFMT